MTLKQAQKRIAAAKAVVTVSFKVRTGLFWVQVYRWRTCVARVTNSDLGVALDLALATVEKRKPS